ncbi:MAG TPA: cytochrome C oxidase subunit IV family protein [Anaerolineales bacterium]|nr:cytochrome C oxidase subunit IV family protein [Anaerolineales bacterium]
MSHQTKERPVSYLGIFILLAVFTLVETLASYLQQTAIKFPVLIALSLVKAVLVLLYFMHLKFDSRIFSYLFIAGCVLSIPLILIMMIVMPVIAGY